MASITTLLGAGPASAGLRDFIASLSSQAGCPQAVEPEVKSYSDAVYLNYYTIGLSLLFAPQNGYKPTTGLKLADLAADKLLLDSIYVYNIPQQSAERTKGTSARAAERAYATYPAFPLALPIKPDAKDKDGKPLTRPDRLDVGASTSGKEFVHALGEPDRKGGGAGPSSGSIGIWCEWSKDGVMVEFGGDEAKGPQAWERGKDAVWKIVTVFSPSAT